MKLSRGYSFLTSTRPSQDFFPARAAEKIVVDQEQRFDTMEADRVADPVHDRVGLARAHRAAHHVLHAAVRAGERASARSIDRGHRLIEEAGQIAIVDHRQLGLGDERHDDVFLAGLGPDAFGNRVVDLQFAAQKILNDLAPQVLGLAHDRGDAAAVEELDRLGIAAYVKAAHHRGQALATNCSPRSRPRGYWLHCTAEVR